MKAEDQSDPLKFFGIAFAGRINLRDEGTAVLLVEQRLDAVPFIEDDRNGTVLPADELRRDHALVERYVGI